MQTAVLSSGVNLNISPKQLSFGRNGVEQEKVSLKLRLKNFESLKLFQEIYMEDCYIYQHRCCTQCLNGQRLQSNVCVDCPAGFACKNPILFSKSQCQPGTYSGNREVDCKKCNPGKSCPRTEMANEENCPKGKNCNNPANPQPCNAGFKCLDGKVLKCGKGKWSSSGKEALRFKLL